jgi:DNA-binding NtrC family response regulator
MSLEGMALFDLGDVVNSIELLQSAVEAARHCDGRLRFDTAFTLFVRVTDFQAPSELLPSLTELRQLASQVADAHSLGGLHLAVARVEGLRGHCADAHRHLEIARRCVERESNNAYMCSVDMIEGSLESVEGNLVRSRMLADRCLQRAQAFRLSRYSLGAATNLAVTALYSGNTTRARAGLQQVLLRAGEITYVHFGALDSVAQLELAENRLDECYRALSEAHKVAASNHLPARSWYDLAHQVTRAAYYERLEEWPRIIEICDDAEPEAARRQYKAVRTALLCAKARALARLGRFHRADGVLATAVRACPRGAVDPLIVLEASKALCFTLRGERSHGALLYDRALAACRAIGHRYHEAWIDRQRAEVLEPARDTIAVQRRSLDITTTALLLTDVATILGAGHSIDLLAHRMAGVLQATPLGPRVEITSTSNCEYQPEPSASWDTAPDGTISIHLRGSDRRVTLRVRRVESIDELSLLKSVADLVQAAVNRTADTECEDDDQNLWPPAALPAGEDTVFQSPRMLELLRITMRLASTELPVLITGETGTGKEIIARLLHEHSRLRRGPFVPFNCSAVAQDLAESQLFGHRRGAFTGATEAFPGLIRAAEHGTLFLDEIGDLGPSVQPKILRFLERGEIHPVGDVRPQRVAVRIVAATNADIEQLIAEGRFRSDLYYRINSVRIALPPLRERKDEIPSLAALFLARAMRECGRQHVRLGDDFVAALLLYDWPGNLRELANEIRRLVALAPDGATLTSLDLVPRIAEAWNSRPMAPSVVSTPVVSVRLDQPLARATSELEQKFIDHALQTSGGRVADAAQLLGLSRKGLFLKRRRRGMIPHR